MMENRKKPGPFIQPRTNLGKGPSLISDLLARTVTSKAAPTLARIQGEAARKAGRADFWRSWMAGHLPGDLASKVTTIGEQNGILTIYAASAAWSARLRYAVQDLDRAIRQADSGITEIRVRVNPRS
jgi:hypothetical protein